MRQYNTIENQIFSWKDWQQDDTSTFGFYEVALVVPVGPYPVGEIFAFASWCNERSTLELYKELGQTEPTFVGKLKVTVE